MLLRKSAVVLVTIIAGVGMASPSLSSTQSPASPSSLSFAGDEVVLAMPAKGGRAMVEVFIDDAGPYDFVIDTGASVSVIDTEIAEALGLETVGESMVGAPGGNRVAVDVVRAARMRVGELEILDATPVALGLVEMSGGLIQGVLGMDLFREALLVLDPGAARAVVSKARLSADDPGVLQLNPEAGAIQFDIDVVGSPLPMTIDTGSPSGFTLPFDLIDELPTLDEPQQTAVAGLVGGSRQVHLRNLDGTIRFAGLSFDNPSIGFMEPSGPAGNIGSAILAGLVVAIDQRSGLISIGESAPANASEQRQLQGGPNAVEIGAGPRRLGLRLGGPGASDLSAVGGVEPGGLAGLAGLREGDRIVTLNGASMNSYGQADLADLFRGSTRLVFEIERAGERLEIRIQ